MSDSFPAGGTAASGVGSRTAVASDPDYPVTAGFDGPMEIDRWRVVGNYILAIPHLVVLYVLQLVANLLVFVGWFSIVFTGQLSPGMGAFIAGVHRYQWRVLTYVLFLRQDYPTFGVPSGYVDPGGDRAWLNITPPQSYDRVAVILRIVYAIPQMVVGIAYGIGFFLAWIGGFFAVLVNGTWPEGLRSYMLRVHFWGIRVNAWYSLLADPYPPFHLG